MRSRLQLCSCHFLLVLLLLPQLAPAQEAKAPDNPNSSMEWQKLHELSIIQANKGQYEQSLQSAQAALKLAEEKEGKQSLSAYRSLYFIASNHCNLAKFRLAKQELTQCLEKVRKLKASTERDTLLATVLSRLGGLNQSIFRDNHAAISNLEECIRIKQALHGKESDARSQVGYLVRAFYKSGQLKRLSVAMKQLKEQTFKYTKPFTEERMGYHSTMAQAYGRLGLFTDSLKHYRLCLEHRKKVLGEEDMNVSDTSTNLSELADRLELYNEGEQHLLHGLKMRRDYAAKRRKPDYKKNVDDLYRDRGHSSPDAVLMWSLEKTGRHYAVVAQYNKAEKYFLETIALATKLYGAKGYEVTLNMSRLALEVYLPMKAYDKGEQQLLAGLKIYRELHGEKDFRVAIQLRRLGQLLRKADRLDEAEKYLQQAMQIWRGAKYKHDQEYCAMLTNLALVQEARGDFTLALKTHQQTQQIKSKVYGKNHIYTSLAEERIANCYIKSGNTEPAKELLQKALLRTVKAYGERHSHTVALLEKIALIHLDNKLPSHSEPLLLRALKINELSYGPDHSKTAKSLHQLARAKNAMGQCKEADSFILQCLSVHARKLGLDQEQTLDALGGFHFVYGKNGQLSALQATLDPRTALGLPTTEEDSPGRIRLRYDQRGKLTGLESDLKQILADREKALGPKHPDVAITLKQMAILHLMRGRAPLAEALLRRSLSIEEKHYGNQHPLVASTLSLLAQCLVAQGRDFLAEPLLKQALSANTKAYGENSRECALSLENLAAWHQRQGEISKAESLRNRAKEIRKRL